MTEAWGENAPETGAPAIAGQSSPDKREWQTRFTQKYLPSFFGSREAAEAVLGAGPATADRDHDERTEGGGGGDDDSDDGWGDSEPITIEAADDMMAAVAKGDLISLVQARGRARVGEEGYHRHWTPPSPMAASQAFPMNVDMLPCICFLAGCAILPV